MDTTNPTTAAKAAPERAQEGAPPPDGRKPYVFMFRGDDELAASVRRLFAAGDAVVLPPTRVGPTIARAVKLIVEGHRYTKEWLAGLQPGDRVKTFTRGVGEQRHRVVRVLDDVDQDDYPYLEVEPGGRIPGGKAVQVD